MTHTSTEQPEALLPCPFCGGRAEFDEHDGECHFTKLRALRQSKDTADMTPLIDLIASWNRRTPQAQAAQAQRVPLSEKQVEDLIYAKHFRKGCAALSYASTQVNLNWYRLGLRDGERAHGITQEKQG